MQYDITRLAAPLLTISLLALAAAAAAQTACGDPRIEVKSDDPRAARLACTSIDAALPRLAACHLPVTAPIGVTVLDRIDQTDVPCLGLYDCERGELVVLHPDAIGDVLTDGDPLRAVAVDDLFAAVVVHETIHAILVHREGPPMPVPDQEYIAYALQYDLMGRAARDAIIGHVAIRRPVEESALNQYVAMLAPVTFGARAWTHFSTPGNGCDFVEDLLAGRRTLALSDP